MIKFVRVEKIKLRKSMKRFAVIMAGGLGSPFWPKSTEKTPKHFIHLSGDGTLIQNTYSRILKMFPKEDVYVVVNETYIDMLSSQLPDLNLNNIITEPAGRNTAPALGLVHTLLSDKYSSDTIMLAFPADQEISNLGEFAHSLEIAAEAAYEKKAFVTIGIHPTRPEKQFGYIQYNDSAMDLGELYNNGIRYCTTFAEKPDVATAKRFIESGDFLWNSGMFILRMDTFKTAFERFLPFYSEQLDFLKKFIGGNDYKSVLEKTYMKFNPISMDYGILEKADNVLVVQSAFSWSDMGTWDELYRLSLKDAKENVFAGDVIALGTKSSLVSSNGKLIGIVGMEDVIVIDTDEALLICKRGESEQVQQLVEFMRKKQLNKFV